MRQRMFSKAEAQLDSAEILPGGRYHKEGAMLVRELIKEGSIPHTTCYNLVGRAIGKELVETNVFTYHFVSGKITFKSTMMKRYCEKISAGWESQA